jgi:hypothetical protein
MIVCEYAFDQFKANVLCIEKSRFKNHGFSEFKRRQRSSNMENVSLAEGSSRLVLPLGSCTSFSEAVSFDSLI